MVAYLDFEKQVAGFDAQISELREMGDDSSLDLDISADVDRLEDKSARLLAEIYTKLTPWQKTQVARHPERPHFKHFVAGLFEDWLPLSGDRNFGDDRAIIGGLARFRGHKVMVIGHEKGDDTESRIRHNFGMGKPEGYRKAIRLMQLADRFDIPVLSLIDTSGAFPGVEAEERGQAEAIARSTAQCLALGVPMIATIVGEGGSGGAIALAAANRVLMLEYAVYAVISPEGCASILWRTADKAAEAATAMKITAANLLELKLIDRIVSEPTGGAHRAPEAAIAMLGEVLESELKALKAVPRADLLTAREEKFMAMGGQN